MDPLPASEPTSRSPMQRLAGPATFRDWLTAHVAVRLGRLDRFPAVRVARGTFTRALERNAGTTRVRTACGLVIDVPRDMNGAVLSGDFLHVFHPSVASALRRHLREGDTVIDGGAHVGFFTILSARLVGARGRVVAFEPHPAVAAVLDRNVTLNGVQERVTVERLALSNVTGPARLYSIPGASGLGSLLPHEGLAGVAIPIRTICLDGYLGSRDLSPDVVKLDLEGAEPRAFEGMEQCLRRVRVLIFEVKVEGRGVGVERPAQLISLAAELGRFDHAAILPISRAEPQPLRDLGAHLARWGYTNVMLLRDARA